MKCTSQLIVGAAAALFSLSAPAQMGPGGGMGGGMSGMGPGARGAVDCSKARNPQHCDDRQKALATCKNIRGAARQDCMSENMPAPDCSKSANPTRCAAMQSARTVCKGKYGQERRACMSEQKVPPPAGGTRGGGMGPGTAPAKP